MISCVFRYYYFLADQKDIINQYTKVLDDNLVFNLESSASHDNAADTTGYFFLDSGRMKILVVKSLPEETFWADSLTRLNAFENQAGLDDEKIMARTTVLIALTCDWKGVYEKACALLNCQDTFKINIADQTLTRLTAWQHGQTHYLYTLEPEDNKGLTFVTRRLPLLQSLLVQMHFLDSLLRDRNLAITQEKSELERQLSLILHSKLVTTNTSFVTNELEHEIQNLSIAYGKIVGDSGLIMDGIERMQNLIARFCHQLYADPDMENHEVIRDKFTDVYRQRLEELQNTLAGLNIARENHQAAIEVVRSKIDIMNSRTNMETQEQIKGLLEVNTEMQKQSLVFQYAAGLIEFIVLAYYSHTLWSHLAHAAFVAIPSSIQFIVVMILSGNIVYLTHLLAEYLHGERHVLAKLVTAGIALAGLMALIIAASWIKGSHASAH